MITAEHEKRIREHYTNLKAHPELIDLIIQRVKEETSTLSTGTLDVFSLFTWHKTPEGAQYWWDIDQDISNFKPSSTLRSNYFEMVQAVKEGKRLQFRGRRGEGVWNNDHDYSDPEGKELVLRSLLDYPNLEYRVKPELKVFKYSTRVYKSTAHSELGLWTSVSGITQERVEQASMFKWWVGDTVEYAVGYEDE